MYPIGDGDIQATLHSSANRHQELKFLLAASGFCTYGLQSPHPEPVYMEGISVREGSISAVRLIYGSRAIGNGATVLVATETPGMPTIGLTSTLRKWQMLAGGPRLISSGSEHTTQVRVSGCDREARMTRGRDVWALRVVADESGSAAIAILACDWQPNSLSLEQYGHVERLMDDSI